ncbi:streptomycin 6-kinase [Murinocardiopsis flavida]|uniref:Streptomycin 6-kinase n=1 Tax=Murinocardiopsis flavida TaxID=645275 RepID=A0A2P8DR78_9ACTN|nr:aminoglycoside phosphotransferase family protein [Murinocardiopsis flavida]PSK99684.1 streptomycin 6-kinase [Murinocardiopsis flavida]
MTAAPAPLPSGIAAHVASYGGTRWLDTLPELLAGLCARWGLEPGRPFTGGSCSWAAPVRTADGAHAVLKVSWPHRESRGEAAALRHWAGDGAIRVLAESAADSAMLLEACDPGTKLRDHDSPAEERLVRAARLLSGLHGREPRAGLGLERIVDVMDEWAELVVRRMAEFRPGYDPHLVAAAVELLRGLPRSAGREVVVHGDFNPGNVLAARRMPWLAIDPKPMTGDPGYDPCPLVMQVDPPMRHPEPDKVARHRFGLVADIMGEPADRLAAWAFARLVESAFDLLNVGRAADAEAAIAKARLLADQAGV